VVSAGGRPLPKGVKRLDSQERDTLTACPAVEELGRPHQRREGLARRLAQAGAKLRLWLFNWCHSLVSKLLDRLCVLGEMCEPHTAQDVGCLGKLDVVVPNDFEAIAPGVAEVEEWSDQHLDARLHQGLVNGGLVIDDKSEVATVIWWLTASLLKREELIA
jgi:hypothetical protein